MGLGATLHHTSKKMNLEIKGKIVKILGVQVGNNAKGEWKKQDFVLETSDAYPKKICICVWNDKMSALEKHSEGDEVSVTFAIASREYNEKWYTEVTAQSIESLGGKSSNSGATNPYKATETKPKATKTASIDEINDQLATISGGNEDDLPF